MAFSVQAGLGISRINPNKPVDQRFRPVLSCSLSLRVTQRGYLKKIMAMAKAPTKPQRSANRAQGST